MAGAADLLREDQRLRVRADTPLEGATGVVGSIAVTGWSLDDVEVTRVRVMRDPVAGEPAGALVFISDAVLVDGARPDVQGFYPSLPRSSRAGWGYLMLTNVLPGLGNGTFRLSAVAEDADGHSTLLGSKTITCSNSTATEPFGAIDTPAQGEVVTTASLNNFGWVLSRGSRKASPPDGGAVSVVIDGVLGVTPAGWTNRSDLSALFPVEGFSGIGNALGVATLDMTALSNGVHTIAWLVTDNLGSASGIGSRYFSVSTGSLSLVASPGSALPGRSTIIGSNALMTTPSARLFATVSDPAPIAGRRGFDPATPFQPYAMRHGRATVHSEDLDSQVDTGVDTLHVWAYPVDAGRRGEPVFVGVAEYGGTRPDVAAVYGERFANSGYGLGVEGLSPGTYGLAVFAYSTVKGGFVPARTVRVTVR